MKFDHSDYLDIISRRRNGPLAGSIRLMLFCLSTVYRVAIRVRNQAFDWRLKRTHQVEAGVISVGNLTAGGTGKTPFVIWLAEQLQGTRGVAIVSRGYGVEAEADRLNDEGLEIQQRLPTVIQVQHPDRVAAADRAIQEIRLNGSHPDRPPVILLDDGFQHRRLARDIDIVLVDSTCPFGFGYLLPRGLLREPVAFDSCANLVVLTRSNLVDASRRSDIRQQLLAHHPHLKLAEAELVTEGWLSADQQSHPLKCLQGRRLFAFCGIGNPAGFLETLKDAGMDVVQCITFEDHHRFRPDELESIGEQAGQLECDAIVCTPKDLVKLNFKLAGRPPIFALLTRVRISQGEEVVTHLIGGLLSKLENAGGSEAAKALSHG